MQAFEPTFFSRSTPVVRAVRAALAIAVVGIVAAAWATAGPGNYDRVPVARVTLPPVTVVAQREAVPPVAANETRCERAQVDAGRATRRVG